MQGDKVKFINRELSWLSFNERVLQEAEDENVPLIERVKFLGIFSSNMDEFFRVRVATLKRMGSLTEKQKKVFGGNPVKVLHQIQQIVIKQRHKFDATYTNILRELAGEKIYIINEKELSREQGEFVRSYFQRKVRPTLVPIMLNYAPEFPMLRDQTIYLAIILSKKGSSESKRYALIELPIETAPRFLVLPGDDGQFIILQDDVIRYCLDEVFSIFNVDTFEAYTLKVTRDAELAMDDDLSESMLQKITKSLKQRKKGRPVRFIYDEEMPLDLLKYFVRKLHLHKNDNLIPGARYHNFKDFMGFPKIGGPHMQYPARPPLPHKYISSHKQNLFSLIASKDLLLHYPYHSFDHVIDLLRESAIDPEVVSIRITLYRLAENSNIINALINAIKNGKQVTAIMELQARFDEEANIYWANLLREEGAKVIFGAPGLKIHAKLCLITRREKRKTARYAYISTGNFNENTARLYSDHALITANEQIAQEVGNIFNFFDNNYKSTTYRHLLVSPFYMRSELLGLIDREMRNARLGKPAYMFLKLNSLVDEGMIEKLYDASRAGVFIRLIVRGICSLKPGVKNMSENIEAISLVDKYLEHSRIFLFANGGNEKVFISSGDWMTRNLDHRIEVACPIYEPEIQDELKEFLRLQWEDNAKARIIDKEQKNEYRPSEGQLQIRAQEDIYNWLKALSPVSSREFKVSEAS
jgi:polyphosphate kinase